MLSKRNAFAFQALCCRLLSKKFSPLYSPDSTFRFLLRDRAFTSRNKDSRLQARPEGEKEVTTKFPLPDKEKEVEIGRLQSAVQDYYKQGNYSRALDASRQLLQIVEEHFGSNHPATASACNDIGLMHKLLGSFDESRKQYLRALKIYQDTVGSDHASYASILHNLGNLNRTQIHFDDTLKATDRLSLIESAVDYLERAYQIRLQEMGPEHPHTVASRSCWGAALSAQLLHHYKMTSSADPSKRRFYTSLLPKEVTQQGWDAAEEHLRKALQTAIENPRGTRLGSREASRKTATAPPTSDGVQTLSASSAAQNLGVFLKTRATTETPYNEHWLKEAHDLYQQVLLVRSSLLPNDHPDLYATKHSLAELLEAMGSEEAANTLRQEIVDTYDPPDSRL